MSSARVEKERAKQIQDKCQNLLSQMLRDEDNKYCVDCDAKGPRWASWNLGIFLCIRCAGIHRNLGVHISKVKSVNLDSWTPEQVVSLQQMGNSRARAVYEANLPDSFRRPQTDCSLESFIRAKYEHKKYIAREWVPPTLPKVNWDKELDEEAEKQRKRKKDSQKSIANQNPLPPVKKPEVVPQLPKPRSSVSPKPNRTSSSAHQDLLGLDVPEQTSVNGAGAADDIFTTFLSAPPAANQNGSGEKKSSDAVKAEEESFFNQTAPSLQEKNKMTKDSILALYGTPSQSLFPPTNSLFGQQMTVQPQFPPAMTNFGTNAFMTPVNQGFPPQMTVPVMSNVASQFGAVPGNPMGSNGMPNPSMGLPAQMGMTNVNPTPVIGNASNNGWSNLVTQNLQPAPGNNPFLNLNTQPQQSQAFGQLPQQISQMSLGTFNSTNMNPAATSNLTSQTTLSSNIWQ